MPMLAACMQRQSSSKRIFKIYTQDGKRERRQPLAQNLYGWGLLGKLSLSHLLWIPNFFRLPFQFSRWNWVSCHFIFKSVATNTHQMCTFSIIHIPSNIIQTSYQETHLKFLRWEREKKSIFSFLTLRIWCTSVLFPHFCFRPLFFCKAFCSSTQKLLQILSSAYLSGWPLKKNAILHYRLIFNERSELLKNIF